MKAQVEIITPAYAKQLLEQNPTNRPVSNRMVLRYASDMKNGRWQNNGQSIILTASGKLLDGQHRMHAVVVAQVSIGMMVVRGAPEESFETIDSGKPRSLSDVLAIKGYARSSVVASVARLAFNYLSSAGLRNTPTKTALARFVENHPTLPTVTASVLELMRNIPPAQISAVVFLGNYGRKYDDEEIEFVSGLASGEGLFRGDPRLTLREWVSAQRIGGQLSREKLFVGTIKAWNTFVTGQSLTVLKGLDGAPPMITGLDRKFFEDVPEIGLCPPKPVRSNLASRERKPAQLLVRA